MSRYPSRIPNRRHVQENTPKESALSFFKYTWNKRNAFANESSGVSTEQYLNNLSYKNRDWSPTRIQNTANSFTAIVRNEDVKEIKLIGEYAVTDFPIECNNRCEFFYAPGGKKVSYSEVTKVEEIEASKYSSDPTNHYKNIGFTNFYQLYKLNEFGVESKLCRMAVK